MILPARVVNIIRNAAAEHRVEPRDILGDSRLTKIARARQAAMIACREMDWCGSAPSFPTIGRWLNRHHTTVLHACRGMNLAPAQTEMFAEGVGA